MEAWSPTDGSIVNSTEAMAISTLGIDHMTIPAKVLQALAGDKDAKTFRGADLDVPARDTTGGMKQSAKGKLRVQFELMTEPHPTDFLADGGKALDESIAADESVTQRLKSSLQ